jgi:predicted metal-binding protein
MQNNYYVIVNPVIDISVRDLCCKPYLSHSKGCMNWNKKSDCPPSAPIINTVMDLTKPIYVIYNRFEFDLHVKSMQEKHPRWSDRQLKCCLYWQPKARKELRKKIELFLEEHPECKVIMCPEAQGVNLTATMKSIGIELEWPPEKFAYQIALAGMAKN